MNHSRSSPNVLIEFIQSVCNDRRDDKVFWEQIRFFSHWISSVTNVFLIEESRNLSQNNVNMKHFDLKKTIHAKHD